MNKLITIFKAMGDENRFKILEMLLRGDLCVGALAHRLGISKAAVSQHLRILKEAGLVWDQKHGYWTHYLVNRAALEKLAGTLAKMSNAMLHVEASCLRKLPLTIQTSEERRFDKMCRNCCQRPEKLKGKPSECTPEQIQECHGDTKEHPCVEGKGEQK